MPLTDTAVRNAKASSKPMKLADGMGLYLQVQPSGSKLWRFKYRFGGKEKLLALGIYPEVGLKEARNKRDEARKQLSEGLDPSIERKIAKARLTIASDDSFEAVARQWWSSWGTTRTPKHAAQVLKRMEQDIFPEIGSLPVGKIKAPMLLAMAKKVEQRGALDLARRAYQVSGQVLRYAVGHGLVDHNAATSVRPGDVLKPKVQRNLPRLDPREVPELLRRIDSYEGYIRTRLAIKLLISTQN